MQALATGNLDQAPPEFRDVLVPLHVRFPTFCFLAPSSPLCMLLACAANALVHDDIDTLQVECSLYMCILHGLPPTPALLLCTGGHPGQGHRDRDQGRHAWPHRR